MENLPNGKFLEDLKLFRWTLYHQGKSEKTTKNVGNNDIDNESENGNNSEAENTSAISIKRDDITESEDIIGSPISYHCEHGHGEIIAEELVIAKYGLEKVIGNSFENDYIE